MNCILYLHTARTVHLHSHLSLSNIEAVMKDVNDLLDVALDYNLSYDEFLSEKVIELGFFFMYHRYKDNNFFSGQTIVCHHWNKFHL